jgi:hypothetical protein
MVAARAETSPAAVVHTCVLDLKAKNRLLHYAVASAPAPVGMTNFFNKAGILGITLGPGIAPSCA